MAELPEDDPYGIEEEAHRDPQATDERARLKEPGRENRELRMANGIVRKASSPPCMNGSSDRAVRR